MSTANKKPARIRQLSVRLSAADLDRLRLLVQRDELSSSEFIRRAIQAYDLMYSRSD